MAAAKSDSPPSVVAAKYNRTALIMGTVAAKHFAPIAVEKMGQNTMKAGAETVWIILRESRGFRYESRVSVGVAAHVIAFTSRYPKTVDSNVAPIS